MKRIYSLLACCLWGALFGLSSIRAQEATPRFRIEIPYTEENGKFIVKAAVNGQTGRFLVDTGAPCCLTDAFASKAGATDTGQQAESVDSNGATVTTSVIDIQTLNFGSDFTFAHLQAMKWEKGNLMENFGIDGIIGYNLFRQGIIKFDHRKRVLTFTNYDGGLGIDYSCAIPMVPDPYSTLLQVKLGKNSLDTVMFDSGAKAFYELSTKSFRRLQAEGSKDLKVMGQGEGILSVGAAGLEEKSVKHRVCIPKFGVGNYTFRRVATITTDAVDSRIGSNFLLYGTVIIDYPSQVFYYIPHDKKKSPDIYEKDWDVIITVMNDKLCAGIVWDYAKLPLKGGEQIVEVNGTRLDKVDTYKAITEGYIQMPGDRATIVYLDADGKERKATIRRR